MSQSLRFPRELKQSRVPPGARYDPVGPGDGPPQFPRGGGGFRPPGSGPFGPTGGPLGGFGSGDFI